MTKTTHHIFGDYAISPVKNAFNDKTSYWISKRGFTDAYYCFTADSEGEVAEQLATSTAYASMWEQMHKRLYTDVYKILDNPVSCGITPGIVYTAYQAGIIKLIMSPNGDGVACGIGDNWFYFGGLTAESYKSTAAYKRDIPEESIILDIYKVLNGFRTGNEEFQEEYLYYQEYLKENLEKEATDHKTKHEFAKS